MNTTAAFELASLCEWGGFPIVSEDLEIQRRYVKMRLEGQSHSMADLLAHRSFPAVRGTDSDFMKGSHIQEGPLEAYRHRMAQQQGVDTNGKRYIAGLARYPGDAEAWVSSTSDVRRICANRGWNCHGAVEYEAPDSYVLTDDNRDLKAPVASDIIQEHVEDRLSDYDPREITPQMIGDVKDAVTAELSGMIDTNPLRVRDYTHDQAVELSQS